MIRPLAEVWRANALLQGWEPIKPEPKEEEQKPKEGFEEILEREEEKLK